VADTNVQYQVVAQRPWVRRLRVVVGVVLVLTACALAFGIGYVNGFRAEQETVSQRDRFQHSYIEARTELESARQKVADLMVQDEIDDELTSKYRESVKTLEERIAGLEEEVRFYRSLMDPGSDRQGLRIERLDLKRTGNGGELRYKLLLTQVEKKHNVVQGQVTLNLIGTRDGETLVLPLNEVADVGEYPMIYRFRYFQDFPGTLELPEGFDPQAVEVVAEGRGGKGRLERSFEWRVEEG
jgi:hypothetical protein